MVRYLLRQFHPPKNEKFSSQWGRINGIQRQRWCHVAKEKICAHQEANRFVLRASSYWTHWIIPSLVLLAVGYISNIIFDYLNVQFGKQYDSMFGNTCLQKSLMPYNLILNVTSGNRLTSNKGHDKFLLQFTYKCSLPRQRALHIASTLHLLFSWA
jgi:hypothetical protein